MSEGFKLEKTGAVLRLTLDRPEVGNMITLAMLADIAAAISAAGRDPDVKAIAVSSAGEDFCRGRDPKGAPEAQRMTAMEMRSALIEPILGLYSAVRGAEVPVVAAVQGAVQGTVNGLGCGLAAVCDVTIAADSARFALPEMRANLPPTLAVWAQLDRIPAKSLLGMVLCADHITADRALNLGLVSDVVGEDALEAAFERFLETLESYHRPSLATCKSYLQKARGIEYGAANDLAGNMLSVVLSSR
jgi:enoyl-CoA hydratase/carnithine racemase